MEECQLFVAGRYVEYLRARNRSTPAWAHVNRLAHGSHDDLVDLSSGLADRPPRFEWTSAIAYLAGEILATVRNDEERLRGLQRQVLIPLELRLAGDWLATMRPEQLVELVSRELESC